MIGWGRTGTELIKVGKMFGRNVNGYETYVKKEVISNLGGVKIENLTLSLKSADYVSLHVPLTKETNKGIHINDILSELKTIVMNKSDILKISSVQAISTIYSEIYDEIAIKDKDNNLLAIGRMKNGLIYPKRLINFNK